MRAGPVHRSGSRGRTAPSRWPVGELLGALREDLFLVFVAERGQPGCRRDREFPGIDERDELSAALAEDLRGVHYRPARDVEQASRLFARSPGLTLVQICTKVLAALPLALRTACLRARLRSPFRGRNHRPLGLVEVSPVQVETQRHLGEGPLALPLHEAGLDSHLITGAVAVPAVDDETLRGRAGSAREARSS